MKKTLQVRDRIAFGQTVAWRRRQDAERYLGRLLDQADRENAKARAFPVGTVEATKHQLSGEALTAKARDHQRHYSSVFRDEPELKPSYPRVIEIVERRKVQLTPEALAILAEIDAAEMKTKLDKAAKAARRKADAARAAAALPPEAGDFPYAVDSHMGVIFPKPPKSTDRPAKPIRIEQGQVDDGKRRIERGVDDR